MRKNNLIGELQEGTLSKFGYSTKAKLTRRHSAIHKAVQSEGPLPIFRKLNAVATLTKRTSRKTSRRFLKDRNWVRKNFM